MRSVLGEGTCVSHFPTFSANDPEDRSYAEDVICRGRWFHKSRDLTSPHPLGPVYVIKSAICVAQPSAAPATRLCSNSFVDYIRGWQVEEERRLLPSASAFHRRDLGSRCSVGIAPRLLCGHVSWSGHGFHAPAEFMRVQRKTRPRTSLAVPFASLSF